MSGLDFLAPVPVLMVRQKTQVFEAFCPAFERQNQYKIAAVMSAGEAPDDSVFQALPTLLTAQEESTCLCRFCCGRNREFTLHLHGVGPDGQAYQFMQMERPFKCSILCLCFLINPQELTVKNGGGMIIGRAVQDWRCFAAACLPGLTFFTRIEDAAGNKVFSLRHQYPTICNGCRNFCAPSCCNKVFNIDIYDAGETSVIGNMQVVFPGCKCPRLVTDATNWILNFPAGASGDAKALLLGGLFLIEYMVFEKQPDQN